MPYGNLHHLEGNFQNLHDLVTKASLADLNAISEKCLNLVHLVVSLVEMGTTDRELRTLLQNCRKLRKLVIACYVYYPVPGITNIFPEIPNLEILGLVGVEIFDEHLQVISTCKFLRVFSLGLNTKVTVKGMTTLGSGIAKVEVLGLFQNSLGLEVVRIFKFASTFPNLVRVVVSEPWQEEFKDLMATIRPKVICNTMVEIEQNLN